MTDTTTEERQASVDQLRADTVKLQNEAMLILLDSLKRGQDMRSAPLSLIATGAAAATALIGTGAGLVAAVAAVLGHPTR